MDKSAGVFDTMTRSARGWSSTLRYKRQGILGNSVLGVVDRYT